VEGGGKARGLSNRNNWKSAGDRASRRTDCYGQFSSYIYKLRVVERGKRVWGVDNKEKEEGA